jgi:hypothetical protein
MENKVKIQCLCGKEAMLEIIGGQYQDTYQGKCICGRIWSLDELSAALAEIDDENSCNS